MFETVRIVDDLRSRARSKRINAALRQSAYFVRGSFSLRSLRCGGDAVKVQFVEGF